MSCSDRYPDWSLFVEREVSVQGELLSPSAELSSIIQWARSEVDAAGRKGAEARAEALGALAQQAVFVAQLAGALEAYEREFPARAHRHLRVLKDQMLAALGQAGIEIVDPSGKPFDEVSKSVDVIGWRQHEQYPTELVAEVIEPIVTAEGAVVRRGRVIMGAPPAGAGDPEPGAEPRETKGVEP